MEEHYWLAGKVNIPENKKQEFNACVMEALNLCGIRKRKTIRLAGKAVIVLDKPQPNRDGIILFDYSIFERKCRAASIYDTRTCELRTEDRGVGEFGLAMNLILLLSECYSEGSCYFMLDRKLVYIPAYMDMLCTLLNRKFMINSRAKVWDILMFMKENPECDFPTRKELLNGLPWDYYDWDDFQMDGLFDSERDCIDKPEKDLITERTQIPNATYLAQMYYLYQTMALEYRQDKVGLVDFLRRLLDLPLAERAKLAKSSNGQGIIAEVSRYVHPAGVVRVLALLEQKAFWDVWDSMNIKGYRDVVQDEEKDQKSNREKAWNRHDFYKQILRDDQDEFLEFWDGSNLVLSSRMQERFLEWKRLFDETEDQPELALEEYLADILSDMEKDWFYRYMDCDFVEAVLANKDNPMWRRALLVLRKVMDDGLERFPELERQTAVRWVKTYRSASDIKAISAYCSLMANKSQRQRIFGF